MLIEHLILHSKQIFKTAFIIFLMLISKYKKQLCILALLNKKAIMPLFFVVVISLSSFPINSLTFTPLV